MNQPDREIIIYRVRYPFAFWSHCYFVFDANQYSAEYMEAIISKEYSVWWSTTLDRELTTVSDLRKRFFEEEFGESLYVWDSATQELINTKLY